MLQCIAILRGLCLRYRGGLLVALAAVACGGKTHRDGAASPDAPATGGFTSSVTDGAVTGTDVTEPDAAACTLQSLMICPACGGVELRNADIVDCAIALPDAIGGAVDLAVVVGCVFVQRAPIDPDAGTTSNADGWAIDYATTPPRLLFGNALCQRALGDVPIFIYEMCGAPC
jgi:hypothetical protein